MHVALLALPGATLQVHGQATAGEAFQVVADLLDVVEIVQAVAAGEQFVEGLRTTQEQQAEQRHLWRHQFQALAQGVLPAVGAAAHHQPDQAAPLELAQALADLAGREVHHRIAAGLLVAGEDQGIEGQRIGFRGGRLLLDEAAERTASNSPLAPMPPPTHMVTTP